MELLAALLFGPALIPLVRKPLHSWLVLAGVVVAAVFCLVSGIRVGSSPASSKWFLWSGLGALACLSLGVTHVVRFLPPDEVEASAPSKPVPKPEPAAEQKLNRRQRRQNRKR